MLNKTVYAADTRGGEGGDELMSVEVATVCFPSNGKCKKRRQSVVNKMLLFTKLKMLESIRSISLGSSKKGPTIPYSSHGTWSPASVVRCKDDFLNEGVRLRVQKTDPCNKRQPLPQLVDWNRNRSESCSGTSIPRPSKVCPRIGNGSPVDELCAECGFCVTHDRVSVQKILYHRGCFKCTQ